VTFCLNFQEFACGTAAQIRHPIDKQCSPPIPYQSGEIKAVSVERAKKLEKLSRNGINAVEPAMTALEVNSQTLPGTKTPCVGSRQPHRPSDC
jgi:hypothetical protein